ncbi:homeobox domain-containing protein [Endozoicomonas sp. GU-1]|uniref:homeobox domain-containing protein n=1 Tax=Endozoicomonas sp. GU-1 TaxID=3009078 RepID=UPI0022B37CD6|nr:homeobox domain-containing protein [Endozoicomonas sp. GU-1]WBA80057.1 homeobox domain-containing protein [Endozoicomonas sp. GU-1]WBA87630.1 homeobox domain-containing protein [Endozoicomonas sp. GU-1]
MHPALLFPDQSDTSLPGAIGASENENAHDRSASGPKPGNVTFCGRFAAAHSETVPVYSGQEPVCSVDGLLPWASQARDFFPPDRFGMGVASIGDVSRNIPQFDQPAMSPVLPPYHNRHQGLAGPDMSSGPEPFDQAVVSSRTEDDLAGSCQSVPSGKITSKADTSESHPQQASTALAAPKRRSYVPEWKVKQLDKIFQRSAYVTLQERAFLAAELDMTEEEVRLWFQNKRTSIKRRCLSDSLRNSAQNMMSSRSVARTLGNQQQSVALPWHGIGENREYKLLCGRYVISSTVAKSPVAALQEMLVDIERNPSVRFSRSVANYCQSRLPQPEPSATSSNTAPGE